MVRDQETMAFRIKPDRRQYKIAEEEWQAMYNFINAYYGYRKPFTVQNQNIRLREGAVHHPDATSKHPNTEQKITGAYITIIGSFEEEHNICTCNFYKSFDDMNILKQKSLGMYNISLINISTS
jgi:hypothetical protein